MQRLLQSKGLTRQAFVRAAGALTVFSVAGCLNPLRQAFAVSADLDAFARRVRGQVLTASHDEYERARRAASFNPRFDRRPLAIVRGADEGDVARTIEFARKAELPLAVRSGGHDVLAASVCDGGIVVDTSAMAGVATEPAGDTAWIGAGARAGVVNVALAARGRAAVLGCNPSVGIGGLVLGGGLGWFIGSRGAACDTVDAVKIVTADGRTLIASESDNAELFWGVRGGGGNFGVATAFRLGTHAQGDVTSGAIAYPGERLGEFLALYGDFMRTAPDELAVELVVLAHRRPVILALVCHTGSQAAAEAALAPLRRFGPPIADGVSRRPYTDIEFPAEIAQLIDWPGYNPRNEALSPGSYWQGGTLDTIGEGVIAAIVEQTKAAPPGWSFGIGHVMHGAVTRVGANATPLLRPHGASCFHFDGGWDVPTAGTALMAWIDGAMAEMKPHAGKTEYVNYLSSDEPGRVRAAYGPHHLRLAQLKRRYDPQNIFRGNRNISPA